MISIKEFFNSEQSLGIKCINKKEVRKICCRFERLGYRMVDGKNYFGFLNCSENAELIFTNSGIVLDFYPTVQQRFAHIFTLDEIDDFTFKVGDKVKIRETSDLIIEFDSVTQRMAKLSGTEFVILGLQKSITGEIFVTGGSNLNGIFISTNMIEKTLNDDSKINDDKEVPPIRFNFDLSKISMSKNEPSIGTTISSFDINKFMKDLMDEIYNCTYSFRFNEQRRNVSLYRNGQRVQLVRPLPEDAFDWMIGLGAALYREIFKGISEVEYVRKISDEKGFYNYCVARYFNFKLNKIDILKKRVQTCKREHCEFQLTRLKNLE